MLQYRAFRLVQSLVERLPRRLAYALAILVARVAFRLARGARARLEANLTMACPDLSAQALRHLARLNFRNHAKAFADLMQLPSARMEEVKPLLRVEGREHLEAALARGRGVLVASVHMGSWELVAAIWSATVAPVSLFAEVLEPEALYDWYRTTRGRLGISVLPINSSGLRHVVDALRANEMVITAIDRDLVGTGIQIPFFGRPVSIPSGPAALALRYGTPLLPVCVYRLPDDSYQAVALAPLFATATGDRVGDERRVTEELIHHLEGLIRQHPEQWHVPHVIWPEQARPAAHPAAPAPTPPLQGGGSL